MSASIRTFLLLLLLSAGAYAQTAAPSEDRKEQECFGLLSIMPALQITEVRELVKPGVSATVIAKRIRELAESGNADAQYTMGVLAQNGYCIDKDVGAALDWHTKAAENGKTDAQELLAANYMRGATPASIPAMMRLNVPEDSLKAYTWYLILEKAGKLHERMTPYLVTLRERLTPAQVAEGEKSAADWVQRHPAAKK